MIQRFIVLVGTALLGLVPLGARGNDRAGSGDPSGSTRIHLCRGRSVDALDAELVADLRLPLRIYELRKKAAPSSPERKALDEAVARLLDADGPRASHQLDDLDTRFREISTEKVASRLCSLLVRLAKQVGTKTEGHTHIYLSRQELAQLTGTTLFTVSRLLCRWETQGIVSAPREAVRIHDLPALQELSQQE